MEFTGSADFFRLEIEAFRIKSATYRKGFKDNECAKLAL